MNARAERLYETKRLTECSIKKHLEFTSGLFNDRLKKSKFSLGGMQKPCRVKELK